WAVRILLAYLIVWAALKIPAVVVAPKMEAVYLGLGELTLLLSGGWTFCAFRGACAGFGTWIFGGRARDSNGAIPLRGFDHSHWALSSCVRGHNGGVCTALASLSYGMGLSDRSRTDCERARRFVQCAAACGRVGRGGADHV